jgi:hypothetical protein
MWNVGNSGRFATKLYSDVTDAGGEWWVADYEPEYDASGKRTSLKAR